MAAKQFAIVQPKNLGLEFTYDATKGLFHVTTASADPGNLLVKASDDGGAMLTAAAVQGAQTTYTLVLEGTKTNLYSHANGVATLVGSADTSTIDVSVNGASIDNNGVLTLTESHGGAPVTVNLGAFIKGVTSGQTNAIALSGAGTAASPLYATLTVDPASGNLLSVNAAGARVDSAAVLAFVNANLAPTLAINATTAQLSMTVGANGASVNLVELVDVQGNHVGWAGT